MPATKADKRKGKRNGRVAFLARIAAIRAGITAGELLSDIYAKHAGHLGIGYTQFTRYVNRHILNKEKKPKRTPNATAAAEPGVPSAAAVMAARSQGDGQAAGRDGPIVTPSTQHRRFVFDPTAAHRKKLV
jgi:hypothetical protein